MKFFSLKSLTVFIILSAIIIGCVPSKPSYEERDIPIGRILKKVEANRRKVKTFTGNGVINIKSPDLEAKASFEIQIKKPDSIKLSLFGPFGIDLARALVTKNSFQFYDALKNKLYVGKNDQDILKKIFKINMSFNNLTDAFAGAVNLTDKLANVPSDIKSDGNSYILSYNEGDEETNFYMDIEKLIITDYKLLRSGKIAMEGKYRTFVEKDGLSVPMKIFLENGELNQSLNIDYRNVKLNEDIEHLFLAYPKDVEIIKVN